VNRTLAQILSGLFHPLLLPTYLFYIILYLAPQSLVTLPLESRWLVMVVVLLTTFVIPGVGTYYLYRQGFISSMQVEHLPERNLPFFFATVCFAVTSYLFYSQPYFDRLFFIMMVLITLSVFLTYLISFVWKISAHGVGLGGALGLFFVLNAYLPENELLYILVLLIILSGAVLSARLALDAHTPSEVYSGFLLGFSAVGAGMWMVIG